MCVCVCILETGCEIPFEASDWEDGSLLDLNVVLFCFRIDSNSISITHFDEFLFPLLLLHSQKVSCFLLFFFFPFFFCSDDFHFDSPGHSRQTSLSVMSKASHLRLCPPTHLAKSLVTLPPRLLGVFGEEVVANKDGESSTANGQPIPSPQC